MKFIDNDILIEEITTKMNDANPFLGIVMGSSLSGKTSICTYIFEKNNFDIITPSQDFNNVLDFSKFIEPYRDVVSISSFFCSKQKVIFIDDFDNITSNDKKYQTYLLNFITDSNFKKSNMKIVITISNTNEKYFASLFKKINVYNIKIPTIEKAYTYICELYPKLDQHRLQKLCTECKGNIGLVENNLHFFYQDNTIKNITIDKTIKDIVNMLYSKLIPHKNHSYLYSYDPRLVAMLYVDNMIKYDHKLSNRSYIVSYLSDLHVIDEDTVSVNLNPYITDVWSQCLCLIPKVCEECDHKILDFTTIMQKTINRCLNKKKLLQYMASESIDYKSHHLLLDCMFDYIVENGRCDINNEGIVVCKDYIKNIGDIKKTYLDKIF